MKYNESRDATIFGSKMVFSHTLEPSNIIWEHREKPKDNFWRKHAFALLELLGLLTLSFMIVYGISTWEQAISDIFP